MRDKMKVLRQLLNWAMQRRCLSADPAAGCRRPPAPKHHGVCFTEAQGRPRRAVAPLRHDELFQFLALTSN